MIVSGSILDNSRHLEARSSINRQLDSGSIQDALKLAKSYHAQHPSDAEANFLLARSMVLAGQGREAIAYGQYAYDAMPQNPAAAYLVGRLYLELKLFELAAPILRHALEVMPQSGIIHWAMADFLSVLLYGKEAKMHYEKAISLLIGHENIDHVRSSYGKCLEILGENQAADAIYQDLEKNPKLATTILLRRANLRIHALDSTVGQQVKHLATDQNIPESIRTKYLLSLGNMYEAEKNYNAAFEYWFKSRSMQNRGKLLVGQRVTKKLRRFFTPNLLKSLRDHGHDSEVPLFIVGMPRSGTTLAEQIISSHSLIAGIGELGRMAISAEMFMDRYGESSKSINDVARDAKGGFLKFLGDEYLTLLNAVVAKPHRFVVDKTPTQFTAMGYIHLCFPKAKFINCQRHPADSFISSYQNQMNHTHSYAYSQDGYAEAFLAKEAIIDHWKGVFPQSVFDLRYEDLVQNPETVVRKLLTFLGLEFEEGCLKFFESGRAVRTFSKNQVRQAVYTSSKERWRNYQTHLGQLFSLLEKAGFKYNPDE